jgi:hypothetical protein
VAQETEEIEFSQQGKREADEDQRTRTKTKKKMEGQEKKAGIFLAPFLFPFPLLHPHVILVFVVQKRNMEVDSIVASGEA